MTVTELVKEKPVEEAAPEGSWEEAVKEVESDPDLESAKQAEKELDEQIKVFDPVALAVNRKIKLEREDGSVEVKEYTQKEFTFMTKIRFVRLLSGTIRLAAESSGSSVSQVISDTLGDPQSLIAQGFDPDAAEDIMGNQFISTVLRLVELAPDFMEELFLVALNVPKKEEEVKWAIEAFDQLTDDEGFEILNTIVAQNSKAIKDFFTERLVETGQRASQEMNLVSRTTE